MEIDVIELNILEKCPDGYRSELLIAIGGRSFSVSEIHPANMVDGSPISRDSQEAYIVYGLIKQVVDNIRVQVSNAVAEKRAEIV